MNILHYIEETERRYDFRIKSLIPLDDTALDIIERVIMRYEPLDMTRAKKTILQARPIDFPKAANCEIYMIDVGLGIPASSGILRQEIARAFNVSEDVFVVRGVNDPLEGQGDDCEAICDIDKDANKRNLGRSSLLSTSAEMPDAPDIEAKDFYGDDYNKAFVAYLNRVAKEKSEKNKIDSASSLFKWMDMPKSDVEMQTEVGDGESFTVPGQASTGNIDSDARHLARVYKNGSVVIKTKIEGVRK